MVGVSSSLRTSPPVPPPPGTGGMGVTSSPFDPLWGLAPPAFFIVDTNGTGLAEESHKDSHTYSLRKYAVCIIKYVESVLGITSCPVRLT